MVPIARRMPQFQVIGGVAVAWIVHIRDSNPTNNRVIWSPITFEMNPIDEKWRPRVGCQCRSITMSGKGGPTDLFQ